MKQIGFKDYLLMVVLIFFSGSPLVFFVFGKLANVYMSLIVLMVTGLGIAIYNNFYALYLRVTMVLLGIFLLQFASLGYVSWLGAFNYFVLIWLGGLVLCYFSERFAEVFFDVLFHFCYISLIFFVFVTLLGVNLPHIDMGNGQYNYLIYNFNSLLIARRNGGLFWEPGAFAGIITLCLALNFNNLQILWKDHKVKLIVMVVTLLTTQSTGGYLIFFVILIFYLIGSRNRFYAMLFLPLLIVVGLYLYGEADFLSSKISDQTGEASQQRVGEYSNNRLGSIIFDLHYISKHPFIGNGMSEKTRYADDPDFIVDASQVGSGNSFSGYMASMGVFFVIGYFVLLYSAFAKSSRIFAILILIVVILNMQDEQWFNYPIYIGLPFIGFKTQKLKDLKPVNAGKEVMA